MERSSLSVVEVEEVHVRRGVGLAQHAVHVEGAGVGLRLKAAREHELEDVAIDDVLLGTRDDVLEILVAPGEGDVLANLAVDLVHARENGGRGRGAALQATEHTVQARDGIVVGTVDVFAGAVEVNGVGDEQDCAVLVVMNGHVGDHVERELGQLYVVGGRVGQVLPVADDIPAEVSDQAGGERRQGGVGLSVEHLQGLGDGLHGVAVDGCAGGGTALPVDGTVNGGEGRAGRRADEGVTCPRSGLTLGGNRGGFEQEGAVGRFDGRALVVLEYEGTVDADGGERVGEDFNVDGNHSGSGCTGAEFFARGGDGAQILHYCTPLGWGDAGGAAMRQGRWRVLCSVYPRVLIRVGPRQGRCGPAPPSFKGSGGANPRTP